MRNSFWSICFLSLFTTVGIAQQKPAATQYSFTLDEAIEYALEHSYESINARQDVAKALKRKWETTADGLPQLDADITYQNQLVQQPILFPAVDQSTGMPIEGQFQEIFTPSQQASATATLSQLIFNGSYLVGLQAAKSFLQYTNDSQEKSQIEVTKSVINTYGGLLVAQESVKIIENNITTLQKNVDDAKRILENGLTEEESVEQLQITLLQVKSQLNNAQRLEKIAAQMFNLTLGIDVDTDVKLTDNLEGLTMKNTDPEISTKNFIIENNIDYRLAYLLTEQRRLELKLERSRALPSIGAFLTYGTAAFDNEFVFFDSSTPWFQSSVLGASINIPIFSSFKRSAKSKQAKIAFEQANTTFTQAQQQIQLQYNNALSDYQFSLENYGIVKQNLKLSERIEKKNQIKYTEGLASSFDLRQAQLQLYGAQQEVLQAMLDIITKKAELETIINTPKK